MNHNSLKKLEFYKIIELLKQFCITMQAKELASQLLPSNNINEVKQLLQETSEAVNLIYRNSAPSFYEIADNYRFKKIRKQFFFIYKISFKFSSYI